jgi:hypothetical protein
MAYNFFGTGSPVTSAGGAGGYTLGMVFTTVIPGTVTGVRFFKTVANTGTHIGTLWSIGGGNLAQVTFTGESTSGWQSMSFSTPVPLSASTQYVISYTCTVAHGYVAGASAVVGKMTGNPLGAPTNFGCYYSGGGNGFPSSMNDPNTYYADVILDNVVVPSCSREIVSSQGVIGALKGLTLGGPTSYLGDGTFGRHMQTGVVENFVDGNPSAPCLQLTYPGFWRFRWGISPGYRSIYISVKQPHFFPVSYGSPVSIFYPPSLIVKANPAIGLNADLVGTAPVNQGWVQIGPVSFTATDYGPVFVELHNNNTAEYSTPVYWDHIITT